MNNKDLKFSLTMFYFDILKNWSKMEQLFDMLSNKINSYLYLYELNS